MKKSKFFNLKQIMQMIIISCVLFAGTSFLAKAASAGEIVAVESNAATSVSDKKISKEKTTEASKEDLTATFSYNMKQAGNDGQPIEVSAKITNAGNDFEGKIQVIVPDQMENNTMYQKEITVKAGETKTISIEMPVASGEPILKVLVVSKKEKEIIAENIRIPNSAFDPEASSNSGIRGNSIASQVGKAPSVGKYALILFVYIMVIGPVLYFALKKKDKRHLIWVIVPVLSVCVSLLIYIVGSDTRVKGMYMGYYSYLTYGENKEVTEDVYFSITSPQNQKHAVSIGNDYAISAIQDPSYYDPESDKKNDSYKTSILYGDEKTKIVIKDYAAFTPVYFKATTKTKVEGSYSSDLTFYDYKMTGSFTNLTGLDISNALLVSGNEIVKLGDVANGAKDQVDDNESFYLSNSEQFYDENFLKQITKEKYNGAITSYISSHFYQPEENTYLIGNVSSEKSAFVDGVEMKKNGEQVIVIPIKINHTVGSNTFIPNIQDYVYEQETITAEESRYEMDGEQSKMIYQFSATDKITELIYSEMANKKPYNENKYNYYYYYFEGVIKAYNYETKAYDTLFTSGQEGTCSDLTKYFDEKNTLELLYEWDADSTNQYNMQMPTIAAKKEVE